MSATTKIEMLIHSQRADFNAVLCDPNIAFEREASFALQIIESNAYAAQIALSNQASLRSAVTNVAAIGITLNPASKLAYLVPRDGRICLDISYMGLLHIAQQCGAIKWGQARVVRAGEHFRLRSIDQPPEHELDPFSKERGKIVGVYVVVKTAEGDYLTHCMNVDDVNRIRDRSSAWKAWIAKKKSCPWVTDYEEMAKKTVIKQASKTWPARGNDRLERAVHYLNTDGDQGIDFDAEQGGGRNERDITPCSEQQQSKIIDSLNALERTEAAFLEYCRGKFKRQDISAIADLTEEEAKSAISDMSAAVKKREKQHAHA